MSQFGFFFLFPSFRNLKNLEKEHLASLPVPWFLSGDNSFYLFRNMGFLPSAFTASEVIAEHTSVSSLVKATGESQLALVTLGTEQDERPQHSNRNSALIPLTSFPFLLPLSLLLIFSFFSFPFHPFLLLFFSSWTTCKRIISQLSTNLNTNTTFNRGPWK